MNRLLRLMFLVSLLFLTACMSTREFSDTVKTRLGTYTLVKSEQPYDNVVVKTDKLKFPDSPIVVKKKKSYVIPAVVYWQQVNVINCDINNRYFVNLFSGVIKDVVSEFQLKKLLGSRRLEISIESVPSDFVYDDRFYGLFTVVCFSIYSEHIYPGNRLIKVSYKIFDGDELQKKGEYSAVVISSYKNNFSDKHDFIQSYMDNLMSNFEHHSEKVMLRILDDLY